MKIFLVRHAETQDRVEKRKQTLETPLSEIGRRQAAAIAERMVQEKVDQILSSPLARTLETAEAIAAKINLPITQLSVLREKEEPNLAGLAYADPRHDKYLTQVALHGHEIDWTFEGVGESLKDVLARARQVQQLLIDHYRSQNILLVTHGYLIGCLLGICVLGPQADDKVMGHFLQSLNIKNTGLTELVFDENNQRWKLVLLNDYLHTRPLNT